MGAKWLTNAVINANKPQMSIIHRIKSNLGGFQPARDHAVVHASDVTQANFCPRHWALVDILKTKKKDEYISTALEATFDVGRATGELVAEKWLGKYAIGHWKCTSCNLQRTFTTKPEKGCGQQGNCQWRYQEVNFVGHDSGVSGSIDVMVDLGVLKVMVTELKIIKPEDFEKIKQPLAEHALRTQLYLKLIADSHSPFKPKINLHEARVFYVSRAFGKKNDQFEGEILPFKEFTVVRDDARVQPLLNNARQIKVFREDDSHPMPAGICALPSDKMAKSCSTCQACFSGNHPAQQPTLEF